MMCSPTLCPIYCANECAHVHVKTCACMHVYMDSSTLHIAHSINIFSSSVEMSSLLAEICSRQEAWMEMRTGTFVNPPQDTGPTGPHPVAQEQM